MDNRASIRIISEPISRADLKLIAEERWGDMVKAVVDVARGILAIGGELHADEEQTLLDDGSKQEHLWGINIYPDMTGDGWIEFDSMINLRPRQNNRTRGVEDPAIRATIREIMTRLIV